MSPLSFTPSCCNSLSPWHCPPANTTKRHASRREIVFRHSTYKAKENQKPPSTVHQYQRLQGVHSGSWHWGSFLVLGRPPSPCTGQSSGGHDGTRKSKKRARSIRRRSWTTARAKRQRLDNDNVLKYVSGLNNCAPVPWPIFDTVTLTSLL